jgi:ArsR family transcriptional regulator, arsenate/arsenite/antimonite-responsive transcriptional repressor
MNQQIDDMAEDFKLLGDKTRLKILALLQTSELCVCDIVELMGMSQPGISQHLRKLKAAGILNESRRGQWVIYSLRLQDKPHIKDVLAHLPSYEDQIIGNPSLKSPCCT